MSCISSRSLKYITLTLHIIVACGGVVLVGFGANYVTKSNDGVDVFGGSFSFGALAISVGGIAFLLSIYGCVAVFLENGILLTIDGSLLFIVFIIQLSLGIMAITKINDSFSMCVEELIRDLEDLDFFQKKFECCGINGPEDYNVTSNYPPSCCGYDSDTTPCDNPYENGCVSVFVDTIENTIKTVGYVGIIFAIVEVIDAVVVFLTRKNTTLFV